MNRFRSWTAWTIAILFATSGVLKAFQPWWEPQGFGTYLLRTGMFPRASVVFVAWLAISLELAAAVALVWERLRRLGWVLTGGLGAAFLVIHGAALLLGDVPACGCMGFRLSAGGRWQHAVMSGLCGALVILAAFARMGRRCARGQGRKGGVE